MSIGKKIMHFVFGTLLLENPSKNKTYEQLIGALEAGQAEVAARAAGKADTPQNRNQFGHIIGIEKWSQRRLKTLQGEPAVQDEYDGYRPDASLNMDALRSEFAQTRQESIAIAKALQAAGVPKTATAQHNDAGDISVGAWLTYITDHANRESRRLKS